MQILFFSHYFPPEGNAPASRTYENCRRWVEAITSRRVIWFLEWLEKSMYAAGTRIVAVGDGYREVIISKGVEPERIDVVMNGLDTNIFYPRPPDVELKKKLGL